MSHSNRETGRTFTAEEIENFRKRILQLEKDSWNAYEVCEKYLGLTENELWIVLEIGDSEAILCQSDLARRLHLPIQTVNSILAKLVSRGWLERVAMPENRKVKGIVFTKKGEEECLSCLKKVYQIEQNTLRSIEPDILLTMIAATEQYTKTLRESLKEQFDPQTRSRKKEPCR